MRHQTPTASGKPSAPPSATGIDLTSITASQAPAAADRIETLEARVRELEERAAQGTENSADVSAVESSGEPTEVGADLALFASWKHGLNLESRNKDFRVHVGGRTQYDNSFFSNDPNLTVSPDIGGIGPQRDSFQFRRGRLRIEGTMYENFEFVAEYDFVNTLAPASPTSGQPIVAVPSVTDLWGTITHLPRIGNLRIGNMKEPIGMEHVNSSRFLPFIERSFLMDVVFGPFNNGFTPGVMMFDRREDERATWALGWFSPNYS